MPKQIEFNGTIHEFPDDFSDADIAAALQSGPAQRATPTPRSATIGMLAPDTMTAPTTSRDRILGMVDQMGARGAELRQQAMEHPVRTAADIAVAAATPVVLGAIPKVPGVLARGLGISQARAGANIQAAAQAAEGAPVGVEGVGREGLRALELQAAGGSMPRAASQLMRRITDPAAGDLTFEEARDFYSNLSRLSANEFGRLNPTMQRQIGAMRQALHEALVESAGTVGEGERYASGVREYARAGKAADYGKRAAKAAGIGLSADYILRRISNAISGSATGGR